MAVTITTTNPQPTWLRAGGYEWANQVGTWAAPAPVTIVELGSTNSLNVSEDNTTNFLKEFAETLTTMSPRAWRDAGSGTWNTQTGTWDTIPNTPSGELYFERTVEYLKGFTDGFTTVDSEKNSPTKNILETLGTVDSLNTTSEFLRGFTDGFTTISNLEPFSFTKNIPVDFNVAELLAKDTTRPFSETLSTVDSLNTTTNFLKEFAETLTTMSPRAWRDAGSATWNTQTGTWDTIPNTPSGELHFERTAEFLRGFTDGFTTISNLEPFSFTKNIPVDFNIAELLAKDTVRPFSESFQFSEDFGVGLGYYQYFEESIGILDTLRSHVGLEFSEAEWFSIIDRATTGAKGTLSDMAIYNDAIESLEDFEDLVLNGRIPGYGEFKNYIQGNYTYQKALIRAILDSTTPAGRVELSAMKIEVDLPDVIERGSVFIEGIAGATVTYNKIFKIIPELTLSVKGGAAGEVLIPEVTSKSLTGFTIKLKNVGTGLYVPGTISWAAHGY
jgi:hypothetical protein